MRDTLVTSLWGVAFFFAAQQLFEGKLEKIERIENKQMLSIIDLFEDRLEKLGINCPEVVMAQIILETNYLSSKIYQENNNLFGMKESSRDFDSGSKNGHACYTCSTKSIQDYAAWQKVMHGDRCATNEDYLYFLNNLPGGRRYAEDPNYTDKLRVIMARLKNMY